MSPEIPIKGWGAARQEGLSGSATPQWGEHASFPPRKWQAVEGKVLHWRSATMTMGPLVSGQCLRHVGLFLKCVSCWWSQLCSLYGLQPLPSPLLGSSPVVLMLTPAQHCPLWRIKRRFQLTEWMMSWGRLRASPQTLPQLGISQLFLHFGLQCPDVYTQWNIFSCITL